MEYKWSEHHFISPVGAHVYGYSGGRWGKWSEGTRFGGGPVCIRWIPRRNVKELA